MVDETNTRHPELLAFPADLFPALDDELVAHILIEMLVRERQTNSVVPVSPETEAVLRRLLLLPEPMIVDADPLDAVNVRSRFREP